ncbi:MAG TPA: glycoside hydrolase family 16 protein [Candidatus Eisenbacteria bacterium]|nr:glycoside hydrolase family 16 protein [Candidatus Eisenbacteria bacterium]
MRVARARSRLLVAFWFTVALAPAEASETLRAQAAHGIQWAGLTWIVREGGGSPGPNHWNAGNVAVDGNGFLHLRIARDGRRWTCAEVESTERLGFGTYTWVVDGLVAALDRKVVLGLFVYPTPDVGPDRTNEVDIEYARWGNAASRPGNFTVWPARSGLGPSLRTFRFSPSGRITTSSFVRAPDRVTFLATDERNTTLGSWVFAPARPTRRVGQAPMPVHMNLWLFHGDPPADRQPVEIVIRSFSFTPAESPDPMRLR